jgi:agmatinase
VKSNRRSTRDAQRDSAPRDDLGTLEPRLDLPFVGIPTFLRSPHRRDCDSIDAEVAIVGFPIDEGSSETPGTRFGPRALRDVSLRFAPNALRPAGFWNIDEERTIVTPKIVDCGDIDVLFTRPDLTADGATKFMCTVLRSGALPVTLGGDHAVSYPVVRAYDGFVDRLTVVQFDSHMDYSPITRGIRHSHGHPMRLIRELSFVDRLIHVGIRGFKTTAESVTDSRRDGNVVISTMDLRKSATELTDALEIAERVYITVDMDVLDPPLVPGTGAPEPEGLSYEELRDALRLVAKCTEVVGLDLVEVNPLLDSPVSLTAFIGVQLLLDFLGHWAEARAVRGGVQTAKAAAPARSSSR